MKKLISIMVMAAVFKMTGVVFAFTIEEAQNRIRIAQQLLIKVDSASKLRPYMSNEIYNSALKELLEAQSLVTEKKYSFAFYKATMSCVKLKTLPILAESKEVQEQILALQPAPKENITALEPEKQEKALILGSETRVRELIEEMKMQPLPEPEPEPVPETPEKITQPEPVKKVHRGDRYLYSLINEASLERKGDVYRRYVPDSLLFMTSQYSLTYSLTPRGRIILDTIIEILKLAESTSVTIAGYSSQNDGQGYSWMKAEAVSKYLQDAGIPTSRVKVYRLSGTELMYPPMGSKRTDRVELIISGLDVE